MIITITKNHGPLNIALPIIFMTTTKIGHVKPWPSQYSPTHNTYKVMTTTKIRHVKPWPSQYSLPIILMIITTTKIRLVELLPSQYNPTHNAYDHHKSKARKTMAFSI